MDAVTDPARGDGPGRGDPRADRRLLGPIVGAVLALLAPAAVVVAYRRYREVVPEPLPIHWGMGGEVDNTATMSGLLSTSVTVSGLLAAGAAVAAWRSRRGSAARFGAAGLTFGAFLAAGAAVVTFAVSAGVARAEDVPMPWPEVVAMLAIAAAAAIGQWAVLPAVGGAPRDAAVLESDGPDPSFAPGEAVVWFDRQASRPMRYSALGALAVAVAGFLLLPAGIAPTVGIVSLVGATAMLLLGEVAVRIDGQGLHVLWGPLAWPRTTVHLSEIVSAGAEEIEPMKWGGWGYRISGRGTAVVLRKGPGLVADRTNGRAFAVTIPHAVDGAAVLRGLLARGRGPGGRGGKGKKRRRR